ncbi:MAG TPA: hypothetical protein DCE44_01135 [Verrucomicrobiales bacterium]|nr:hypothetical protein [Verrucomicrobiales bacterium]
MAVRLAANDRSGMAPLRSAVHELHPIEPFGLIVIKISSSHPFVCPSIEGRESGSWNRIWR